MIKRINFSNFKALENFSITLKEFNVLTGPNNNGKSSILDGLRLLQAAYRYASRVKPIIIRNPFGNDSLGFQIPENSLPLNLENIQTNFNTTIPSTIKFSLDDGKSLTLVLHPEHSPYLLFDTNGVVPKKASDFRSEFPLNLSIIPTLGPLEIEENLLDEEYVRSSYGSRRSPRMFRSYWYYNYDKFDEFKRLVESTWPGMSISLPKKRNTFEKGLIMFCEEDRIPREISSAGFGFQIWLQLLTHIVRSKDSALVVVDEPEIYLHPDLQHKVLHLLRHTNANTVIATHSVEIINSVEPSDVVLIDKRNRSAKRISDLVGLQAVSNLLGSGQNIELTRLARGKKILFVEGKDIKLLSKLAKIAKFDFLFSDSQITIIPIEGFSQHERIIHTNWAFSKILGEELKIAVLLDRDYRDNEEVSDISKKLSKEVECVHILKKKELENYFLIPSAIDKAIQSRLDERLKSGFMQTKPSYQIHFLLMDLCDKFKSDVMGQLIGHNAMVYKKTGKDLSTIISELNLEFENQWKDLFYRLKIISGKQFLSCLNEYLQENFKISITYSQIGSFMSVNDVDNDLIEFFKNLELLKR